MTVPPSRTLRRIGLPLVGLFALAAVGVGWHYSGRILGPDAPPAPRGQTVLAVTDTTLTLATTWHARRPGIWAIEWRGGYGRIGPIVSATDDRVTARFTRLAGPPPGKEARLAGFARDANPRTWLGIDYRTVRIPARSGVLPSWLIPGPDSTWVVFVHGRGATRAEVLRLMPDYLALGLTCLDISYRNDGTGPVADGGQYRLGATEWQDLEDAVRWARSQGARDVLLMGCSMGGAIVLQFLRKSPERSLAVGAVLDAPAIDWRTIILTRARQDRVPGFVADWGMWWTEWRSGIRWNDLDQRLHVRELHVPLMIFHGVADSTVPIRLSRQLAAALPSLVTLHETPDADHVESKNYDAVGYTEALDRWLARRGIGPSR